MKSLLVKILCFTIILAAGVAPALDSPTGVFPIRGFCLSAPRSSKVADFVAFIQNDLVPHQVNTLVLRVDFNYKYTSHPELANDNGLSSEDVKKIVAVCRTNHIRVIPSIDLLGHQSWHSTPNNLLRKYPEFDENPEVKYPVDYKWPNADGLYCKSYCPLLPKVHEVVFALMDELCDAFETDAFHAGMDEVFYLANDKCPRCAGHSTADLFAGEVTAIHDHLAQKQRSLWIWGDRLIDGHVTGLGEWEASFNETAPAIDKIPKDVMICDWHYDRPDPTAVYFAMKGFHVVTCPWKSPSSAVRQAQDLITFRKNSTPEMAERFAGVVQTIWTDTTTFVSRDVKDPSRDGGTNSWNTFTRMFEVLDQGDSTGQKAGESGGK